MKRSTDRIITSHVGSLVRPPEVVALLRNRPAGKLFEGDEETTLQKAIDDAVALQKETGIDVPNDGEFPKSGFANYITDRLTGFEEVDGSQAGFLLGRDRKKFLDAYAEMEGAVPNTGPGLAAGAGRSQTALTCTGPVTFVGQKFVEQDIANMKASMARHGYDEAFYPATAPGTIELQRPNKYYKTNEEYLDAIANAMHEEYKLITDAGFVLQIDDPRGVTAWDSMDPPPPPEEYAQVRPAPRRRAEPRAAGHPGGAGALPRLLGKLARPAHDGHRVQAHRQRHAADQGAVLLRRGGEPAPRARVPRLRGREAARRQDPDARRDRPHDELRRAPGAGGGADHELRQARRARERDRGPGLRLRAGLRDEARAREHPVGEVPRHARGRRHRDSKRLWK